MSKIDEDNLNSMKLCSLCPGLCRFVCPVFNATKKHSHSPSSLNKIQFLFCNSQLSTETAEEIYSFCINCGNCTEFCCYSIKTGKNMISLRESINTKKNSFMISDEKNMIPENFLQDIPQGIKTFQTTGIFPGSMTLNYNPVALEDFMHICRTFKIEKISLVDSTPFSSGYENWINGRYELYNSIKKKNTEWMKKYKLIVFLDEKDLYMFKNIYGQNSGNQPELIHYSEFFYRYHWKWNDVRCKNESVYYIPECSMINHLGLKETPLRILEYLAEKVDFPDEKHHCLSGSGIITGLSENIIHKTVNTVLEQISIEKYHQIITTGPLITYLINKILPRNNFTDLLKFIRTSTE